MNKLIIVFAFLVIALAYVESTGGQCPRMCRKGQSSPIRCVRDSNSNQCRKMKQCAIDEENCRRRILKRPRITSTSLGFCRNIHGNIGSGQCAGKRPIRKPRSACDRMRCTDNSTVLRCYRSKKNNCQLLTACELRRINCRRGWSNALANTDYRHCDKTMRNQLKKCRNIPHRG